MNWIPQDLPKNASMTKAQEMKYPKWIEAVDSILLDRASITSDDIDNYDWIASYLHSDSPTRAAIEGLFDVNIEDLI